VVTLLALKMILNTCALLASKVDSIEHKVDPHGTSESSRTHNTKRQVKTNLRKRPVLKSFRLWRQAVWGAEQLREAEMTGSGFRAQGLGLRV